MIFRPTGTSELLIKAVKPYITKGKLLDLGCGCGIVGKSFTDICEVSASDIDDEATETLAKDFSNKIRNVFSGNLFEPWQGYKFDYIVDDVSGVAEEIAKISPWFEGVPCESGEDGTKLICKVLTEASGYLTRNGKLFFPVVSLSNKEKILRVANENFNVVECLKTEQFPLPQEMYKHKELLSTLRLKKHIDYVERFGLIIFWTDIYMACNV